MDFFDLQHCMKDEVTRYNPVLWEEDANGVN